MERACVALACGLNAVVDLGVDQNGAHTALAKFVCQHQPAWTKARNQNIRLDRNLHRSPPMFAEWITGARRSSNMEGRAKCLSARSARPSEFLKIVPRLAPESCSPLAVQPVTNPAARDAAGPARRSTSATISLETTLSLCTPRTSEDGLRTSGIFSLHCGLGTREPNISEQ